MALTSTPPADSTAIPQPVPFPIGVSQVLVKDRTVLGVQIRWAGFPRLDVAATPDGIWHKEHVSWPEAHYTQVLALTADDGARWVVGGERAYLGDWRWTLTTPEAAVYDLPVTNSTDHALVYAGQVRAALEQHPRTLPA